MKTSYNKITKKDQFEIKKIATQALPTLPKRMKEDEKNAIYTYLPGRFKKYSVENLYNHIKLWQAYPDDTFAMHQQRNAAKHAGSNIGIFKPEKEGVAAAPAEVEVKVNTPADAPHIIEKAGKELFIVDCYTVVDLSKVYAVTPCADLVEEEGKDPQGHCLVFFESVRGTNTMVKVPADIAISITEALMEAR